MSASGSAAESSSSCLCSFMVFSSRTSPERKTMRSLSRRLSRSSSRKAADAVTRSRLASAAPKTRASGPLFADSGFSHRSGARTTEPTAAAAVPDQADDRTEVETDAVHPERPGRRDDVVDQEAEVLPEEA